MSRTYPHFTLPGSSEPFLWKEDDDKPPILIELTKIGDLTGHTITLYVQRPAPFSGLVIPATPIDLTEGTFRFDWGPGDLVKGLSQLSEWEVIDPGGKTLTYFTFLISVAERVKVIP